MSLAEGNENDYTCYPNEVSAVVGPLNANWEKSLSVVPNKIPVLEGLENAREKRKAEHPQRNYLKHVGIIALSLALLPVLAQAQAVRYDNASYTVAGQAPLGSFTPILAVPGATVAVCQDSLCAQRATTYTSAAASSTCGTQAQLTPATGGVCTATTDNQGNFGFWVLPGSYYYQITLPQRAGGGVSGPYPVNLGASAGCPSAATCDANYLTLANAIAAAGSGTLYISRNWNATPTQSAANLSFLSTGKITMAANARLTVTGTITAPPTQQIFNTAASGSSISLSSNCCTSVSAAWWGPVSDWNGTTGTDNLAAFNSFRDSAIAVNLPGVIPCGQFYLSAAWTLNFASQTTWTASGCGGTRQNGANYGTVLAFGSGGIALTGFAQNVTLKSMTVLIPAAGSGPALSLQGSSGWFEANDMAFIGLATGARLVDATPGASGDLDLIDFEGCEFTNTTNFSVEQIYFHTSGGVVSPVTFNNKFRRAWIGGSVSTAPFFKADNGGLATFSQFVFRNIQTEMTPAGAFSFNGVNYVTFDNYQEADVTPTAPVVYITAPASWPIGQYAFFQTTIPDGTAALPSIQVDFGSSLGQMNISVHNGQIPYARITGNSEAATILYENVKYSDEYDHTPISTRVGSGGSAGLFPFGFDAPALGSTYNSATQLMPASSASALVNAACKKITDLVINGSDTHKATSTSWTPNSDDIGRFVIVYSGTGFHAGKPNRIVGVSGGAALFVNELGTAGSTGGTASLNRFSLGIENDRFTPGNAMDYILACTANADASVTPKTVPMTITDASANAVAFASLPTVNKLTFAWISDSSTNTWGATITGGGSNKVLGMWNGANWTVFAK